MSKDSFNIPAKARVRKMFRRFLKQELKNEPTSILCLSGVEAIEITDIYDALGYKRSAITTCEIDRDNFHLLEIQELGIKVVHSDVVEFLKTTDKKFDIINLDFCGNMNSRVLDGVLYIFKKRLLKNNGIFACTFLARRENKEVREILKTPFKMKYITNALSSHYKGENEQARDNYDKLMDIQQTKSIMRDGIDFNIVTFSVFGDIGKLSTENEKKQTLEESIERIRKQIEYENSLPSQQRFDAIANYMNELDKRWVSAGGMIPIKIERYSYTSDNGSPMRTSFYKFRYIEEVKRNFNWITWEKYLRKILDGETIPPVYEIPTPQIQVTNGEQEENMPKKIPKKLDDRTRKQILRALRCNIEKHKIARIFGVTVMQVSALESWRTMGKY